MAKTSGLGKGLISLIPQKIKKEIIGDDSRVLNNDERILQISLNRIKPNPLQPRSDFSYEGLEELVESIKEHGILQPLIASQLEDGSYQLIAGERRFRAAQTLELATVPVIVRAVGEQEKLELALVENLQRRDLNAIEEAVAYQRLMNEFNLIQEEVAKKVGKSRAVIANTLRLLTLPTEIQKALVGGKISYSTARIIAGLPPQQRLSFFQKVLSQDLTVRAVENQARQVIVKRHLRRAKDLTLAAHEETLQQVLNTKVEIKKSGQTGQIIIDFFSDEELVALIKKISG